MPVPGWIGGMIGMLMTVPAFGCIHLLAAPMVDAIAALA